jgi:hypothetical protein
MTQLNYIPFKPLTGFVFIFCTALLSITLGASLAGAAIEKDRLKTRVSELEHLMEICLIKRGYWNLQGKYFFCEAVYTGIDDEPWTVYLKQDDTHPSISANTDILSPLKEIK